MMAAMSEVAQGRWREPIIPGMANTHEQVAWARNRPAHARTDLPAVGEVVGLRLSVYGPVVRARILRVDMETPADTRPGAEIDWNVWCYRIEEATAHAPRRPVEIDERGNRAVELVADPWPNVLVETLDGPKLRTETREARIPGSPGWLRSKE